MSWSELGVSWRELGVSWSEGSELGGWRELGASWSKGSELGGRGAYQNWGTLKLAPTCSEVFLPMVVGTLKPSITFGSLSSLQLTPLAPVCSQLAP